ncbi:protein ARV1 isoform X1 [Maniola hyperantus]|uniref:protein ARV1 isoform X1 n=1 Tax=Aphantopus hyperantus TaxID=2795564 RepID=UPI0015683E37|nr:protein ARV1 [Maniola hyperantus]
MTEKNEFKCVNCGVAAAALYRNYGPSVLKLTKCENCKGIVDKYIEYDPVIVVIDLVLMSREAQRHIIYNTEFKSYWKLLIILMLLETYGVWRSDSLFSIALGALCDIHHNTTDHSTHVALPINLSIPAPWRTDCSGWAHTDKDIGSDLFIWEKDFYIQFLSILAGIVMFISTVHITMKSLCTLNEAPLKRVLKSFSLANVSLLFCIPMLVWGNSDTPPETRLYHYLLVQAYSFVVFYNVFRVLYAGPRALTVLVLLLSTGLKHLATFHVTPALRSVMQW